MPLAHTQSFAGSLLLGDRVIASAVQDSFQPGRYDTGMRFGSIAARFGIRLRHLRLARHWTQTQLADFLGIDRSFISDLERGKKSISLGYLETIADGFDLTLEQLLSGV